MLVDLTNAVIVRIKSHGEVSYRDFLLYHSVKYNVKLAAFVRGYSANSYSKIQC